MYQEYLNQVQSTISTLSSDELKELLNNDEMVEEKVDEVLEVLKAQKNSLFEENRTKAELNLEKEPQIIELRGKVTELMEQGQKACQDIQEKLTEVNEKSGKVSEDTALALLQTAAAESEERTEDLYKKFTDNDMNVDQFLEEFLKERKTMHLRKLRAEKLQDAIRKASTQRGSFNGGNVGPAYSNIPGSGFYPKAPYPAPGSVPYPMSGPRMPMPPPRPF